MSVAEDLVLEMVTANGLYLAHVLDINQTAAQRLAALTQNGLSLEFIAEASQLASHVALAVSKDGLAIQYATTELIDSAVEDAAIAQNGRAIQFIAEPTQAQMVAACAQTSAALAHLVLTSKTVIEKHEIYMAAVGQNGNIIKNINLLDTEMYGLHAITDTTTADSGTLSITVDDIIGSASLTIDETSGEPDVNAIGNFKFAVVDASAVADGEIINISSSPGVDFTVVSKLVNVITVTQALTGVAAAADTMTVTTTGLAGRNKSGDTIIRVTDTTGVLVGSTIKVATVTVGIVDSIDIGAKEITLVAALTADVDSLDDCTASTKEIYISSEKAALLRATDFSILVSGSTLTVASIAAGTVTVSSFLPTQIDSGTSVSFVEVTDATAAARLAEITLEAVDGANEGKNLKEIPEALRTEVVSLQAVVTYPLALEFVPAPRSEEVKEEALAGNGLSINFLPLGELDGNLAVIAVTQNGNALKYVPTSLRDLEVCIQAMKGSKVARKFVPTVVLELIESTIII